MIGEKKTPKGERTPPAKLEGKTQAPAPLEGERRIPIVLNGNSDGTN